MPISVNQIFSDIQNEIGDISGDKIQQAEYIDLLNNVASKIAEKTEAWIDRYISVPNPSYTDWTDQNNYYTGNIVKNDGNYYYCLIGMIAESISSLGSEPGTGANWVTYWTLISQWTVGTVYAYDTLVWDTGPVFYFCTGAHTATLNNEPPVTDYWRRIAGGLTDVYSVTLPFSLSASDLSPYRILRVVRGGTGVGGGIRWNECREFSAQSVGAATSGNLPFMGNRSQLGAYDFSTMHTDPLGNTDGNITLVFGSPFDADESCVVDFITNRPFRHNPFDKIIAHPTLPVMFPDALYDVFFWGLLYRVLLRLFNRGDIQLQSRVQMADQKYQHYLLEAAGYTKNFKDNKSAMISQPINWFQEARYRE